MYKTLFLIELIILAASEAQWYPGGAQMPPCQVISRTTIGKGLCFPTVFCNYFHISNNVQGDCPINSCCFVTSTIPKPVPVCGKKGSMDLRITPRILGGTETGENELCWQVAIIDIQSGRLLGGGSLIKEDTVLTSAHILNGKIAPAIRVRVGDADLLATRTCGINNVTQILIHPDFNAENYQNDIALLKLDKNVDINSNCACLICLPNSTNSSKNVVGKTCIASGYGSTLTPHGTNFPHHLNRINVTIVDESACLAALQKKRKSIVFHPSYLCSSGEQGKDTCDGDGGGPVVCESGSGGFIQYGIISWGIGCDATVPFVNADVSLFVTWILQMVESSSINSPPVNNVNVNPFMFQG